MEYMPLTYLAVGALLGFFGGYLKAYGAKKGENLATHEDIDKLVDQVRAVTTTTKEIEAKISNEVWDRQKQWELKRDLLFDAAKRLTDVENKLLSLNTYWTKRNAGEIEGEESRIRLDNEYVTNWQESIRSFEEIETMAQIVCSAETMRAFAQLGDLLRMMASKIVSGDKDIYSALKSERDKKFGLVKVAIRKELGMSLSVMPLSSVSSAAAIPAARAPE
jgi:hypothetical protein